MELEATSTSLGGEKDSFAMLVTQNREVAITPRPFNSASSAAYHTMIQEQMQQQQQQQQPEQQPPPQPEYAGNPFDSGRFDSSTSWRGQNPSASYQSRYYESDERPLETVSQALFPFHYIEISYACLIDRSFISSPVKRARDHRTALRCQSQRCNDGRGKGVRRRSRKSNYTATATATRARCFWFRIVRIFGRAISGGA